MVTPAGAASAAGSLSRHELRSRPAQRGTAGARLVGRGLVRGGSMARVGPLPLLALPIRFVRLPPLLRLWMQMRGLMRCLLPTLDVLACVVVALRVTAQRLTVTALLSLALRTGFGFTVSDGR